MTFFGALTYSSSAILLASMLLLAPAGWCQSTGQKSMPPLAPDFTKNAPAPETTTEPQPSKPTEEPIKPPDLPVRPPLIPIPPAAATDPTSTAAPSTHKRSLAWRSRAQKLKLSATAQQKTLLSNYDAAIMNLLTALAQTNLRIDALNAKAGELLAAPVDVSSSQKFVFVFAEMPPGTVTIKASAWTPNRAATATIESIFQLMDRQAAGGQR